MMAIGKTIFNKALVFTNIKMEMFMKDNLFKIRNKERGNSFILMAVNTRDNL